MSPLPIKQRPILLRTARPPSRDQQLAVLREMLPLDASQYRTADAAPVVESEATLAAPNHRLGSALNIRQVAQLIGCSPWTVRQSLMPRGLPHFRFTRLGRLTFYREQVIRWIESQQGGQRKK